MTENPDHQANDLENDLESAFPPDAQSRTRCAWVPADDPLYQAYHDDEWGKPQRDARDLYEQLMLEAFQAGLSWKTILHKREGFRRAFGGFEPERIARYDEAKIEELLQDTGIVRHRGKILATIKGAQSWLRLERENPGGFSAFIWQTVEGKTQHNSPATLADVPGKTAQAELLSKRLKKEGFNFVGPTICYAFMQAAGLVDDHTQDCFCHQAAGD
ncbi:DNA-3-methyladenine glycosylase I [Rhodovibrionaceae bacterium A322]